MGNCLSSGVAIKEQHAPQPQDSECGPVKTAVEPSKPLVPLTDVEKAQNDRDHGLPYKFDVLGPPVPPCESDRMATMRALNLDNMTIDAPPDPEIENILKLVASIFQAPSALVALFDDQKIFIRETEGNFKRGDFPWRWSFCGWTMASSQQQIMVIPDATKDPRFAGNINVTCEGGVRFYCGAPLIASNGHRLGTLCFADSKPREFDMTQASILGNFAEMVVRHVEKDIALQLRSRDNEALSHAYRNLKRTIDCFDHCVVLLDTSQPGWAVMYTNAAWEKATGCGREGIQGCRLADIMEGTAGQLLTREHLAAAAEGKPITIEGVRVRPAWQATHAASTASSKGSFSRLSSETGEGTGSGRIGSRNSSTKSKTKKLVLKLRPATTAALDDDAVQLAVPSWVVSNKAPQTDASKAAGQLFFMTIEFAEVNTTSARMALTNRAGGSLCSPIAGLQLSQLLGTGSFGSVYAASWFGTPVAVKVIDQDLRQLEAAGAQMEAVLGSELRHPHIVATLTYAIHSANPTPGASSTVFSDDTARESSADLQRPAMTRDTAMIPAPARPPVVINEHNMSVDTTPVGSATRAPSSVTAAVAVPPPSSRPVAGGAASSGGGGLGGAAASEPSTTSTTYSAAASGISSQTLAAVSAASASQQNSSQANALFSVMEVAADSQVGFLSAGAQTMSDFGVGSHNPGGWGLSRMATPHTQTTAQSSRQQTWIVLEFCDKGTLQDAVDRGWLRAPSMGATPGRLNMAAVVSTAYEVASALHYLHSHGVVHGDLSAWNVLLTTAGTTTMRGGRGFIAKVADFGLSRTLDIKTRIQTRTYGTITHQPPETLLEGHVSRETDTYSLGVLLWQLYTGSRPWAGMSHAQIIMAVASGSARLTFPAGTPEDYASLALACLSYNVAERPTMAAVCTTLDAMRSRYSIDQPRPVEVEGWGS